MDKNYEIVKFVDNNFELDVRTDKENDTVWLSQKEMAFLFDVSSDNIGLHIKNILKDNELTLETTEESSVVQLEGNRKVNRKIKIYNLDMIISVGYRVNSKRGILFRKWANKILKQYLYQGYAVNQKRLDALHKTINIQNRMLSYSLNIDHDVLESVINQYTNALDLLDNYDHNVLNKPKGNKTIYELTYVDCRNIIDSMKFNSTSKIFGMEKEEGKLNGILAAVYQNVFGQEVYPTLEDKAAHFIIFHCKRSSFC